MPSYKCGGGFGNINLEQYARQDQIARVSRATVAEATTGVVGMGNEHATGTFILYGRVGDDFETSLFRVLNFF
jgi:hypothetical protein